MVRIITNAAMNLTGAQAAHYALRIAPLQICVDGVYHDTRDPIPLTTVDQWVRESEVHPDVIGTSAAEFTDLLKEAAAESHEILVAVTSRKIIQTYQAATAAAKTFERLGHDAEARIAVADTASTDIGAGLITVLAAEAARAGLALTEVSDLVDAAARVLGLVLTVETLDWLVRGGRASALRAWLADVMRVRPLLTMTDGELGVGRKISARADRPEEMVSDLVSRFGRGRRVWAAVADGQVPEQGRRLAAALRSAFEVEYLCARSFVPTVYLHVGKGALAGVVLPLDALPWTPATAPALA